MAKDTSEPKTYPSDLFIALLAVFQKKAGTLGVAEYEFMASHTGSTATALQHKFREPKRQAAALLLKTGDGAAATPTSGKKRGKKVQAGADGDDDEEATPTPAKKQKTEGKGKGKKGAAVKPKLEPKSDDEDGEAEEDGEEGNVYGADSHFEDAVGEA